MSFPEINIRWRFRGFATAVFVALLAAASASSRAAERVRPGALVTLPVTGVSVRTLDGMELRPSQAPSSQQFRYKKSTGKTGEILGFDPRALWRRDQSAGRFVGDLGTMRVFELKYAPLDNIKTIHPAHPHVRKEDYAKARQELKSYRPEAIRGWVEYLTGRQVQSQTSKARGLYASRSYVRCTMKSAEPNEVPVYLVQVRKNPRQIIAIWVELAPGREYSNVQSSMFKLVEDVRPASRVAARRNDDADRRMQSRRIDAPGPDSQTLNQTRQEIVENIRNLPDWWFVETSNYVIASDLPSRRRRFVRDIQEGLHALRTAYEQLVPPRREIEEVSVVRVFAQRRTFTDYLGENALKEWALGMWMPGRRELVISPFDEADDKRDRESMLRTVFHEGFHQYVHYALDSIPIPIWINEGHAAFFEGADIGFRGKNVGIAEVESRTRVLENILDERDARPVGLARLMTMSTAEFYQPEGRLERYSLAWGLVYFLRKAADQYPDQPYDKVCDAVFETCAETGGDWRAASRKAISMLDMDQLEEDFQDFWTDRTNRKRAERRELFD